MGLGQDRFRRAVQELIDSTGKFTRPQLLAKLPGVSETTIRHHLKSLLGLKEIVEVDSGKPKVYGPGPNFKPARQTVPAPVANTGAISLGARVMVRTGASFPSLPEISMGGWTGYVKRTGAGRNAGLSLVEFDSETLIRLPAEFWEKCKKSNLRSDAVWMKEPALAPAAPHPKMEEESRQMDRLRSVFRIDIEQAMPSVSPESLRAYHAHFARNLSMPFKGEYEEMDGPEDGRRFSVDVTGLLDANSANEHRGLYVGVHRSDGQSGKIPLAWVEVPSAAANRTLLEDYLFWFYNWRD